MNRRNFLRSVFAGFTILPGAGRIWHATRKVVVPKTWENLELVEASDGYLNYLRVLYTVMLKQESKIGIPDSVLTGSETIKFAWDDEPEAPLGWAIVEGREGIVSLV